MSDPSNKKAAPSKSKKRSGDEADADAKKAAKKTISDTFRHTMLQDAECKTVTTASFRDLEETDRRLMRAAGNWILKAQELMRNTGAETLTERVTQEIVEQGDSVPPLLVDLLCCLLRGVSDERVLLAQAFLKHHGTELAVKNADESALLFGDAIAFVQAFIRALSEHGGSIDVFQSEHVQRLRTKGVEIFDSEHEISVIEIDAERMRRELCDAEKRLSDAKAKLQEQKADMDKIKAVDGEAMGKLTDGIATNAGRCEAFVEAVSSTPAAKDLESVGFIECVSKMLPPIRP